MWFVSSVIRAVLTVQGAKWRAGRQQFQNCLATLIKGSTSTSKPSLTKKANKCDSDRKYDETS